MDDSTHMPVLGPLLCSRYQVAGELGRGGMGVVYAATELASGRRVAIKVLHRALAASGERTLDRARQRERLLMEARAAASVRHRNVVDTLDLGTDGDELFLVMERLDGVTLDSVLRDQGCIAPAQALAWLLPIMDALAALHRAGVVHRDVKPSNIFLSEGPDGITPKLLDFGLARSESDPRVTGSGQVIGTPSYMAPEHAAGESVGPAADVWSLGIVLYECIAGSTPFPPLDRAALAMQVLLGRVRPLLSVCPTLPVALANAVDRALKRDRAQRYRSMPEMARALTLAANESGVACELVAGEQTNSQEQTRAALRGAPTEPQALRVPRPAPAPAALENRAGPSRSALLWALGAFGVLVCCVAWLLTARVPAAHVSAVENTAALPAVQPPSAPLPAVQELPRPSVQEPGPVPPAVRPVNKGPRRRPSGATTEQPVRRRSRSGVETEWL